jgi:ribonuclease HI
MSVKGFLEKYFKVEPTKPVKVAPESVLEPMIGTKTRTDIEVQSTIFVEKQQSILHIFTDGACSDNGKRSAKAGYGVHVYGKPEYDISLRLLPNDQQTNNRAELYAIQSALDLIDRFDSEWFKAYTEIYIWSDSEYSIHSLTKWAKGWKSNNWKKKDGGLVQNIDIIRPIFDRLLRMPRVSLHHVRGHQDSKRNIFPYDGNYKADILATKSLV